MENKYRILWLDDEFENEQSLNIPLPIIRMRYPELDIEPVAYVDKCEEIIKNRINDFQSVILDANGKYSKMPNQEPNKIGFEALIDQIKALNTSIPVYIFSGQLSPKEPGDQADITKHNLERKGYVRGVNLFLKEDTYRKLLDRVKDDLESGFAVFYKYPEILDNVLNFQIDKEVVNNLLTWIDTKDDSIFPGYSQLRRIVVDYIWNKVFKPFIGLTKRDPEWEAITTYCMEHWEMETIRAFKNLVNKGVHDGADMYYMREVVANSFIIIMMWYNKFMHRKQENDDPSVYYRDARVKHKHQDGNNSSVEYIPEEVGIVEIDKDGFYYVGSYIINTSDGQKYKGKEVEVIHSHRLPYQKIADKFDLVEGRDNTHKSSGNSIEDFMSADALKKLKNN